MMVQLKGDSLANALPLMKERIESCGLTERMSPDYAMTLLKLSVATGSAAVFVDKENDPGCVLILSVGKVTIFSEHVCLINLLHVSEAIQKQDPRLSLQLFKEMIRQTELHATASGADVVRATSWVWRDNSSDIGSFYIAADFELQSHEYVKILTPKKE